ncbi:MAG TPA: sugar phosphate isomerase/epimerase family protein [Planctomycetota bacterium]|nr:sugar phosphate isomerase/epimerase family protein [Planctomycetota bacterium]
MKKGCCLGLLPKELELEARLALARKVGFEGVEPGTIKKKADVRALKKAAANTGIAIVDIMNSDHWGFPLSSPKKSVVAKSIKGMVTSMQNAHDLGTDCVLLVPAVVNDEATYEQALTRSRAAIRKMLPTAKKLGVVIAVENVWNRFLLGPVEFNAYVDSFKSPWVKAYFDVGNILIYGWPQQWIRTLGRRIVRMHLKDFDLKTRQFVPLREGSVNWPAVRKAIAGVRYNGWLTAEVRGGDEAVLRGISEAMDKIIAGE